MNDKNISTVDHRNVDKQEAQKFLNWLANGKSEPFTFQTFDDTRENRKHLARIFHGTLDDHFDTLRTMNEEGAGVFVTINQTDLKGRKNENITEIRAVFADTDGAPIEPLQQCALTPCGITNSSEGKYHVYWRTQGLELSEFRAVQKAIADRYNTDHTVIDLARVMRLPGFYHLKDKPQLVTFTISNENVYPRLEILKHFPPTSNSKQQLPKRVNSNLETPPHDWSKLGVAISNILGAGEGKRNDTLNKESFRVFGTVKANRLPEQLVREIIAHAASLSGLEDREILATMESAWRSAEPDFEEGRADFSTLLDSEVCEYTKPSIEGTDLLRPPGIVGVICDYMQRTAKRSRPELYPLAALHLIALIGRRRESEFTKKLNLLTLAIAPTAAGKEHPQDVIKRLAYKLSNSRFIHGNAGSFRELIYNLIESDGGCLYIVDEIHSLLNSMRSANAQNYERKMESEILSMCTTELYTFRGMDKRAIEDSYKKKLETIARKLKREDDADQIQFLEHCAAKIADRLSWLDNGLPNPFFSLMGHSVPSQLDAFISPSNVDNGLLGRMLIIRCPESREELQRSHKIDDAEKQMIEDRIVNALLAMKQSKEQVAPDDEAKEFIDQCVDWFDADEQRNHPLLGGIYARAPEQLYKVASLFGLETNVITLVHAKYAYALIMRSIEDVMHLLLKSHAETAFAKECDIFNHAREVILRNCKGQGRTPSALRTIVTKPKSWNDLQSKQPGRDLFMELVSKLEEEGKIELRTGPRKRRYVTL